MLTVNRLVRSKNVGNCDHDWAQTHAQNCVETLLTPHWPIVFFSSSQGRPDSVLATDYAPPAPVWIRTWPKRTFWPKYPGFLLEKSGIEAKNDPVCPGY